MEDSERLCYSVVEAAARLGLSRGAAFLGCKNGSIPHIRIGKRILIPKIALEKLLAEAGNKTGDDRS